VLAVAAAMAIVSWRVGPSPSRRAVRPLGADSPFANARPGVAYVGDAACARCHADVAADYRRHPMGRSLAPIAEAGMPALAEAADGRPLFEAGGLEYSIEDRGGRVYHREVRRDASGRVVAHNEAEVQYVLGSGNYGASFLVDRDGSLFQSPISWYARERRWDLSPGYQRDNVHFDRPVTPRCLYCHANRVEPVEGATNRYRPPTFRGHAIGCERCHGPGALHAARPGGAAAIVNPAALEPALRDAVCEQCHLMGKVRVLKVDRREDEFRPGLPLSAVWSVFESAEGADEDRFVGQVEQMHESRCYRAGSGRLGCISCHDPHRRPGDEERVDHYRGRCLECHGEGRGCALPEPARREKSREDDCTACHMPRSGRSDIPHVATTDHRILRDSGAAGRPSAASGTGGPPLVLFHPESSGDRGSAEVGRDLGVALASLGKAADAMALPLLEAAVAARPDDAAAWQFKGDVLGRLGRPTEGLAAFREALALDPDRESTLTDAAELAAPAKRPGEARAHWDRAIAMSPWRASYRTGLAALCFQERDWSGAASACREAVRLDPFDLEARRRLVRALLHLGERATAGEELRALLALGPPDRDELIRRFSTLAPVR
jgi:Flp pilus assembly protein TadD